MVQVHSSAKSHHLKSKNSNLDSEPRSLGFSTWVSENSIKLFILSLLTLTVAAFFSSYSNTSPSSLFCFRSAHIDQSQRLRYPELELESIQPILDKSSPFSKFHSEQWIVVSVSDYPSTSLESLVRIKGWQVLAVGNSRTPKDWNLRGAIFLSLELQADLGFQVVDYLPYDSYFRKNVGYLFAIQHGARRIFDADDRGEVIGGNIRKHFDLDLRNEKTRKERILQYTNKKSNRTVVNPYVHFGQRSVWPRGLPLENVGEVNHEEFYQEVSGGMQYIQQGICNGLPDVDSIFYSSRKTSSESFDIRFDELAPKVAAAQGIMVPVNSFNTLFHYDAFWGLMLPVSVSSMASDIMRGYWAQRLLWEIGGLVVVYPPTVHRNDKLEAYPFMEEKDLHINVGQLISFLTSWRSEKNSFYEKVLDLSFSIAEKGFWNENDVKLAAAWIQDLISVGYQQPSQEAIKLNRKRAKLYKGRRKEFIPTKLPSMHLGVKESETVNYEIGNLIRWRRSFGNVVLVMFVSGDVQHTALEWRLLYGRVFKTVVILSSHADADLAVAEGDIGQLYKYLPKIFKRFDKAEGFIFLHDTTVLNYWNLLEADRSRLWIANKVLTSTTGIHLDLSWFSKQADMVNGVVGTMPAHLQVNYKRSSPSQQTIALCGSEIFYIPQNFVQDFIDLVDLVGTLEIHHAIAIPMFFMSMDLPANFDPVLNRMICKTQSSLIGALTYYSAEVPAVHPWNVSTESDFVNLVRLMAAGDPLLLELV